jgi:hypothetical protein
MKKSTEENELTTGQGLPAPFCSPLACVRELPACAPPFGESGEEYYCKRDDFVRYIEDQVNPAREAAGLQPLCWRTAEECYRILNDFARKWGCNPIQANTLLSRRP